MSVEWQETDSWIAVFDILGFRAKMERASQELSRAILFGQIDELHESLDSEEARHGRLRHMLFADTILIFSPTDHAADYPWFLRQCKNLATHAIRLRLPLRGAISVGRTWQVASPPMIVGLPFLEAFSYCEDQDWIGLLLTPSATAVLREAGLEPTRHDFVRESIPLRKRSVADVYAYRFEDGASNFESPLLAPLAEMRRQAAAKHQAKYDRTIEHIRRHHRAVG